MTRRDRSKGQSLDAAAFKAAIRDDSPKAMTPIADYDGPLFPDMAD